MATGSTEFINGYIEKKGAELGFTKEQSLEIIKAAFLVKRELMRLSWMPEVVLDGFGDYVVHDSIFYSIILAKIRRYKNGSASREATVNAVKCNWSKYKLINEIKVYKTNERNNGKRATTILNKVPTGLARRLRETGYREAEQWKRFIEERGHVVQQYWGGSGQQDSETLRGGGGEKDSQDT
jgi:hypothetical protein